MSSLSKPPNTHRRDRPTIPVGFDVPGIGDKRWHNWTRPIRMFIGAQQSGRSWPELHAWRRENNLSSNMIRQLLAWLEYHKEARFNHRSKKWQVRSV